MDNTDSFEAPQKRLTAREFVLEGIRDAMLDGRLRAGQELDDQELARAFGVSRTPVREALKVLEVQGFIVQQPYAKPVVATASADHLEEVYLMRIALEGLAVGRASTQIDADGLAALEDCARAAQKALQQADRVVWSRCNREFHVLLCTASRMPLLTREVGSLIDLSGFYSRLFWHEIPQSFDVAHEQHLGIVRACRERNAEEATRLMQEHIRASYLSQAHLAQDRAAAG